VSFRGSNDDDEKIRWLEGTTERLHETQYNLSEQSVGQSHDRVGKIGLDGFSRAKSFRKLLLEAPEC
jgi:hypothetical protein